MLWCKSWSREDLSRSDISDYRKLCMMSQNIVVCLMCIVCLTYLCMRCMKLSNRMIIYDVVAGLVECWMIRCMNECIPVGVHSYCMGGQTALERSALLNRKISKPAWTLNMNFVSIIIAHVWWCYSMQFNCYILYTRSYACVFDVVHVYDIEFVVALPKPVMHYIMYGLILEYFTWYL